MLKLLSFDYGLSMGALIEPFRARTPRDNRFFAGVRCWRYPRHPAAPICGLKRSGKRYEKATAKRQVADRASRKRRRA